MPPPRPACFFPVEWKEKVRWAGGSLDGRFGRAGWRSGQGGQTLKSQPCPPAPLRMPILIRTYRLHSQPPSHAASAAPASYTTTPLRLDVRLDTKTHAQPTPAASTPGLSPRPLEQHVVSGQGGLAHIDASRQTCYPLTSHQIVSGAPLLISGRYAASGIRSNALICTHPTVQK